MYVNQGGVTLKQSPTEQLFKLFDETAQILRKELDCTYLDALCETGENLFQNEILQEGLSETTTTRLKKLYQDCSLSAFSKEEIRKSYQLAILKGMKGQSQSNHQMTPDSIGYLMGYFTKKFVGKTDRLTILDPAIGTGNLLATIIQQHQEGEIVGFGVEIDDVLIQLAYIGASLLEQDVELFHQDSLRPLFIDPVDMVVCDLPVGYYPDDVQASTYQLKSEKGHSYAHHLFIEQSLKHTKPGGYLFFLIPNGLFESEQADQLQKFLREEAIIQGVIQLPLSIFTSENAAKSLLIIQKKKEGVTAPKEVLLAALPSLSNPQSFNQMLVGVENWFKENK